MVPSARFVRLRRVSRFHGRFALAGDKSISHRLAILGALAHGQTTIGNFSAAADCQSTLDCLARMGVAVTRDGPRVTIEGRGPESWYAPSGPLDAGNSGSTLRMLAGPLAGRPFRATLTGDVSLNRRPMERVAAPLRAMGARVETTDGRPPMTIQGGALTGIEWALPVASAQVKTAVLLAGLQADGTTTVREPEPSRDHTERLLPAFGATVHQDGAALSVRRQDLRAYSMDVPGDVSSAAFLLVAALVLPDAHVRVERVLLNPRRTAFLDVLRAMGGDLTVGVDMQAPEPVGWIEARSSRLHGIAVDPGVVPALIDEVPALCAAAALAEGTFSVSGAAELRVKESDRIAALADGLGKMGAAVEERPDGLVIQGGRPLHGASVASHDDHRIAMALAVAALAAEGETEIEGGACVAVSFPDFPDLVRRASR
jgi:3-phosphoshikimate 1-carboxyvinyltransferase